MRSDERCSGLRRAARSPRHCEFAATGQDRAHKIHHHHDDAVLAVTGSAIEDDVDESLPQRVHIGGFAVRQQNNNDVIVGEPDEPRAETLRATAM